MSVSEPFGPFDGLDFSEASDFILPSPSLLQRLRSSSAWCDPRSRCEFLTRNYCSRTAVDTPRVNSLQSPYKCDPSSGPVSTLHPDNRSFWSRFCGQGHENTVWDLLNTRRSGLPRHLHLSSSSRVLRDSLPPPPRHCLSLPVLLGVLGQSRLPTTLTGVTLPPNCPRPRQNPSAPSLKTKRT